MSGSLFTGQPIPPQPTASDTSSSYPLWLQQFTANLGSAATGLASQPYSQFPGPQVAAPSAATTQAQQMALQNVGDYQPDLTTAQQMTNAGSTPLTSGAINQYLNPYTSNVIGGLQSASNYNLINNQLPAISSQFVGAGQAASPQMAQADNNALYNSNQALDQATAGALASGYNSATQTAEQQQALQLQGGAQQGQLGALTQQLGGYDVGQVAASGQSQDTQNQANINAAMNNFYSQQQWPYQNLAYASNIIRGQPVASNTYTVGLQPASSSSYTASPLSAFIGTTLGGSALLNGTNNSTSNGALNSALSLKSGGHVKRPANENRRGAMSSLKVA